MPAPHDQTDGRSIEDLRLDVQIAQRRLEKAEKDAGHTKPAETTDDTDDPRTLAAKVGRFGRPPAAPERQPQGVQGDDHLETTDPAALARLVPRSR